MAAALELARQSPPAAVAALLAAAASLNFDQSSEPLTGSLLAALAASKPGGRLVELGTGTGVGTAWLSAGMHSSTRLTTVEVDPARSHAAQAQLGEDLRIEFVTADAGEWLEAQASEQFDLIFADATPGKYTHFDHALRVLKVGGLYVIDDMLPQPNWPEDHAPKVQALIHKLLNHPDLRVAPMIWATGVIVCARTA